MPICVECAYHGENASAPIFTCGNDDLPVTDFVTGIKDCHTLNPTGNCKGFKLQRQRESIYELKKDEDLAKIE